VTDQDDELVIVDGEVVDDVPPLFSDDDAPDEAEVLAAELESEQEPTPEEQAEIVKLFPDIVAERDDYLDLAKRVQAEFENYKRRVENQRAEQTARAAEHLVVELLPVLDACEAAILHGAADVEPIHAQLYGTLSKLGLDAIAEIEVPFDPTVHEAVLSEPGSDGPTVVEVLRTGFSWNGRVVRPAMVKVRG
jgi:molecular chaperone GrpE